MNEKTLPERLYEAGFTDLISVIPPGAQLLPSSKIPAGAIGKIPGRRHVSGLWAGFDWRRYETTADDIRRWTSDGASFGLRATRFPGVDIDCTDPRLAQMIEEAVLGQLGPAPVRVGRAPKRLLMYALGATAEPFTRMRLLIKLNDGTSHLVEILGEGQQYLVDGTHPSGAAYQWLSDPLSQPLTPITQDDAKRCLDYLEEMITLCGIGEVRRVGDGRKSNAAPAEDQKALHAPSIDALREAVAFIPNNDDIAPGRDEYIKIGYAIRGAAGEENEVDGFEIFAGWAGKHEADGRVSGNPETWLSDWRRMVAPFSLGWSFLAQLARGFGYNDAAEEFPVIEQATGDAGTVEESAPAFSDQDLAEQVIRRHRGILRYIPQKGSWMVWDGARWVVDAELQAEDLILQSLREIALKVLRQGSTPKEKADALRQSKEICSAYRATAVAQIIRANRAIAVSMDSLDHDQWVINTPAGIIDLKTGKLGPSDPDALATKMASVAPDFESPTPLWSRFLKEVTLGDQDLEDFLQRYAGYCLTGSTREQKFAFLYGKGENGKSVFLNQLVAIMADYAVTATMDTFTASASEKHSTDIASLKGARLAAGSETTAGKKWDETRIKSLTGGEPVTARFMRKDNFTFIPQAKLLFIGNNQPALADVGKAMKRRILMVPFRFQAPVVDLLLPEKLRAEGPAILAWMIKGCLAWQEEGLAAPAVVQVATDEYFDNEDSYGKWANECVVMGAGIGGVTSQELFQSYQEWAFPKKEPVGTLKRLSQTLIGRGWERWQDPKTRQMGFANVRLNGRTVDFAAI